MEKINQASEILDKAIESISTTRKNHDILKQCLQYLTELAKAGVNEGIPSKDSSSSDSNTITN
jgi:hypothetical protein